MPVSEEVTDNVTNTTVSAAPAMNANISELKERQKPKPEKWFTPAEVEAHNSPDNIWLSWLGNVYNVTTLVKENQDNVLLKPIIANAGYDISHWFDPVTGDIKTHMDPKTGIKQYYTPQGRFLHIPPSGPMSDWGEDFEVPWWKDQAKYGVGKLTKRSRKVRIVNLLTKEEHVMEVSSEEKVSDIQERYQKSFNSHAKGYIWKHDGLLLDMSINLSDNGIKDDLDRFDEAGIDENEWLPTIHLYFSDDLTVA